jgi:hypothetical protein
VILVAIAACDGDPYSVDIGALDRLRRDAVVTALSDRREALRREPLEDYAATEKFLATNQSARAMRARLAALQPASFVVRLEAVLSNFALGPGYSCAVLVVSDGSARLIFKEPGGNEMGEKEIPFDVAERVRKLVVGAPARIPESKLRSSVDHRSWWFLTVDSRRSRYSRVLSDWPSGPLCEYLLEVAAEMGTPRVFGLDKCFSDPDEMPAQQPR